MLYQGERSYKADNTTVQLRGGLLSELTVLQVERAVVSLLARDTQYRSALQVRVEERQESAASRRREEERRSRAARQTSNRWTGLLSLTVSANTELLQDRG